MRLELERDNRKLYESTIQTLERRLAAAEAELAEERRKREHADERTAAAEKKALIDPLTGLHNRAFVVEVGKQMMERAKRGADIAVLMVDLDHFKLINDESPNKHADGDKMLVAAAEAMRSSLREEDIKGRWGGEEFVIVLNLSGEVITGDTITTETSIIVQRFISALAKVTRTDNGKPLTASIGVAILPGRSTATDSMSFADLVERADASLYKAKDAGRNRVEMEILK